MSTSKMNMDSVNEIADALGVALQVEDRSDWIVSFRGKSVVSFGEESGLGLIKMHGNFYHGNAIKGGSHLDLIIKVYAVTQGAPQRRDASLPWQSLIRIVDGGVRVSFSIPSTFTSEEEMKEAESLYRLSRHVTRELNRAIEKAAEPVC